MVIVKLQGGLGNQMFQYAAGRAASLRVETELKLDVSSFQEYKLRKYSLQNFKIKADFALSEETREAKGNFLKNLVSPSWIKEEPFSPWNSKLLSLKDNAYLDGYWQSEKYFKDKEENIRQEFSLKKPFQAEAGKISAQMEATENPVSIHVRRGDYVSKKHLNEIFGVCHPEYYEKAVAFVAGKTSHPVFFIFSDDIAWVKENLKIQFPAVFVSKSEIEDFEELALMSECRHNIIANSTFSWWGAWLNRNPEKIVIAPKKWFNHPSLNTKDLIPEGWVKI